ncbi:MAG: polymer-forming cytoskeletal protein [Acidobacteria bacterium]|nr:polymer-forming cytoskeletal protein [Acidobacteriota bacterium]
MGIGKGKKSDEIVSLLGKGTEISGDISFSGGMRVDGAVKGTVRSEGSLIIGPSGLIDAEINIRNISINGEFRGILRASDRVEIHKEGKVFGDIYSPCLIIEAGATFEGRCNMTETDTEPQGKDSSKKSAYPDSGQDAESAVVDND